MTDRPYRSRALSASESEELARHVCHDFSDARLEQVWAGVHGGLQAHAPRRAGRLLWPALVSAVVAVLAVVWLLPSEQAAPSLVEGAALETASDELSVDLQDGSVLAIAQHSRVALARASRREVTLALQHGHIDCDVAKDPSRRFVVDAGLVSVKVIGTRFAVTRGGDDPDQVEVTVERGVVEVVVRDESSRRLQAGETWRYLPPHALERQVDQESPPAPPKLEDETEAPAVRPTPARQAKGELADELFDRAMAARRGGDASAVATLLDFTQKFPRDGRAGVVWFEIGRLRMDKLGDLQGAEKALTAAVGLGAGALTDDALARLVRARAALGMQRRCQEARARYLERYASGVHIETVRRLCVP